MNLRPTSSRCALLPLLVFAGGAAHAATAEDPGHAALRELKATYEKAVHTGDLSPLRPLFTPDTTAVMILGQEIRSFAELEQHWKYVRDLIGAGGSYTTTLKPEPSLIVGDFALARGTSDELVKTDEGTEYAFTSRWTAVCRQIDGQWKVLRLHGSMDPVTNVFTTTFMHRAKLIYGLGGIVLGAATGLGIGLLRRKRSAAA